MHDTTPTVPRLEEFRDLIREWEKLGFLDEREARSFITDTQAPLIGYINTRESVVIYGRAVILTKPDSDESAIFLFLHPDCQTEQFLERQDLEGNTYRMHTALQELFTFYHTDIEFLNSIKDKYIDIYNEAKLTITEYNDDPVSVARYLFREVLNYVKKMNRKAKHESK